MAPSSGLRACPERNKGRNAAELCSSQKSLASRWPLLMGSCHQPPGSATSLGHPSQPLPSRIKFSLNNSADYTHEAFPLRVTYAWVPFKPLGPSGQALVQWKSFLKKPNWQVQQTCPAAFAHPRQPGAWCGCAEKATSGSEEQHRHVKMPSP